VSVETRSDETNEGDGTMTFEQFQASGRDVEDLRAVNPDYFEDYDYIVNGRAYLGTLWAVPCVTSGVGWSTIIGNREFTHPSLEMIELKLYHFALSEGMTV
jgi:hypothetical protein